MQDLQNPPDEFTVPIWHPAPNALGHPVAFISVAHPDGRVSTCRVELAGDALGRVKDDPAQAASDYLSHAFAVACKGG